MDSLLKLTLRASEPSRTLDTRKADRAKEDIFHKGGWHGGMCRFRWDLILH